MSSILWIILGLILVGVLSFGTGVLLGRISAGNRVSAAISAEESNPQMTRLIQQLNRTKGNFSQDAGRRPAKIEATAGEPSVAHGQPSQQLAEFVVDVVGKILESNEALQRRLHSAESKLQEQSTQLDSYLTKSQTDSLTRLPNRRVFDERLRYCIDEYENRRTPFALLMLDLDRFKAINDGFGHLGGDYALRELGAIVSGFASERSFAARLGGDELAFLAACDSAEEAHRLAEDIRAAVANHHFSFEGVALAVTLSVGMAMIRPGEDGSDLLGRTDQALYAAKAAGRNCCFFHDGKRCRPIDAALQLPEDREGILELCDELRHRMAEIVKQ
jgi:diguanylate cyclase